MTSAFDPANGGCAWTRDNLVDAVGVFIVEARNGERWLREFMLVSGLQPADRTLAHSWRGLVGQAGVLPDGGWYFFHGIGCKITLPGRAPTDIDWTPDGRIIIDVHQVYRWLVAVGASGVDVVAVADELETMAVNRMLIHESPSRYVLTAPSERVTFNR
jgi:hypothetical protein